MRIKFLFALVFAGLVSSCSWQSDYRVHAKPEDHAKMLDQKEHLEPNVQMGRDKVRRNKTEEVVPNPDAPPPVFDSFDTLQDKATKGYMEEKIIEYIK